MFQSDAKYYHQRAEVERAAAERTENKNVAEIHLELARQYDALVEHAELRQPVSIFRTVSACEGEVSESSGSRPPRHARL